MALNKMKRARLLRGDRPLWIIIVVLCVVSLLVVYSSTASMAYRNSAGNTTRYVVEQVVIIVVAFALTFFVHLIDPRRYLRWSKYLLYLSIVCMLLTYTSAFGATINGASRWVEIPFTGRTFMPSEPLKISLVLFLAVKLGARQRVIDRVRILPSLTPRGWKRNRERNLQIFNSMTMPLVLPIVVAVGCVFPSNLSTALIIALLGFMMLHFGRVRRGELVRLCSCAVVCVVVVVLVMSMTGSGRSATWVGRIESFVSPITGVVEKTSAEKTSVEHADHFQKTQAKIAIASGGVFGKGPGNSTQRSLLPHPYSDYAYAFIIEEYGLFGGVLVLVLYLWMLYRAGVIMRKSSNVTYKLVVVGLMLIIMLSAFVNMGVSVGILPVTGQPLPLISRGDTTLLFTSLSLGIILGISRTVDRDEAQQRRHEQLLAVANSQREEGVVTEGREVVSATQRIINTSMEANEDFEFGIREGDALEAQGSQAREVVSLEDDEIF